MAANGILTNVLGRRLSTLANGFGGPANPTPGFGVAGTFGALSGFYSTKKDSRFSPESPYHFNMVEVTLYGFASIISQNYLVGAGFMLYSAATSRLLKQAENAKAQKEK